MAKALARKKDPWGALGPAMAALPTNQMREFVYQYCVQKAGYGALTAAARLAGYGKNSTADNQKRIAWKLSRDPRILAAIAEESQKIVRVAGPEAANALLNLVRDPTHREHGRAISLVLERTDPSVTHSNISVLHKVVDEDEEAREELRALRALGTSRAKLIELYGPSGLARIEAQEAADTARRSSAAKVIDVVTESFDGGQ